MKRTEIKRRPLSDTVLANLEAEQTEYRELDGNGLYFRVKPDGNKSWQLRYKKPNGKWSWLGIGGYPEIGGQLARKKAQELIADIGKGENPIITKQERKAKELEEKIRKNQFTFEDFLDQLRTIRKMGSLRDLLGLIPGMDKAMKNVEIDDRAFNKVEAIILSMTKEERKNPKIINGSRRKRIANGSGSNIQDVNRLIKQFEDMSKLMKNISSGKRSRFMQNLKMPMGFGG